MFGVWFFTLYALLNSCVFYGSSIAEKLWKPIRKMPKGKNYMWIFYGSVAVAASVAAICFYRSRAVFDWYERFLWYVGTPFLVLAPVFAAQKKWGRVKETDASRNVSLSCSVQIQCHLDLCLFCHTTAGCNSALHLLVLLFKTYMDRIGMRSQLFRFCKAFDILMYLLQCFS